MGNQEKEILAANGAVGAKSFLMGVLPKYFRGSRDESKFMLTSFAAIKSLFVPTVTGAWLTALKFAKTGTFVYLMNFDIDLFFFL
jgi:hypothetical protein